MPDYLTKEEIKQWRGSLEKITLEEFAKRLGKVINDEKETNDMVDMVYKNHTSEVRYVTNEEPTVKKNNFKAERISSLAQQSFEREKELSLEIAEKNIIKKLNQNKTETKSAQKEVKTLAKAEVKQTVKQKADKVNQKIDDVLSKNENVKITQKETDESVIKDDPQIKLKKSLTEREQVVFEYLLNNINKTVYAKDLAKLLDLPRDYVYKYIKNLRAKIEGDKLENADKGGFILNI